jgi:hypothetical protein
MKAYVLTTGIVFALIVLAHVARVFAEGPGLLVSPTFLLTSLLALALLVWSVRVFRKLQRPSGAP